MIHNMLKRFSVALNLPKGKSTRRQSNRWRQFDPQVKMHYAHTVFFYSYMRASILDSSSSPPCNNLHAVHQIIHSERWLKQDDHTGWMICKIHGNKLFTGILATQKTFTGKEAWVFTGMNKTFMRCDGQIQSWDLWLWRGLFIRRDTLRKRWEEEIDEEGE